MNARQTADQQCNQGLQKTEDQLVKHVGRDIGRHTHTGTMFLFNNLPLPADDLDRVKETVPYTDTRQGEGTRGRSFLCYKHIGADHKGDQGGYNGADRQHDPVALIDKHPQEFPEINPGLADPSNIPQLFSGRICHDVCPPFFAAAYAAYFSIRASARPSPPSSLLFTLITICSMVSFSKNSLASPGLP